MRFFFVALACSLFLVPCSWAETTTVRLRLAWGSGDGAKHRWFGTITCSDAILADLQPLGVETDATAAIQLDSNELRIEPLEKRGFDGCDVTITADLKSLIRFELRTDQSTLPTVVEVPLEEIVNGQIKEPIDSLESFVLAYRSPGDRFRVISSRENLIFQPGESWPLQLQVDFAKELEIGTVIVDAKLYGDIDSKAVWQATQEFTSKSALDEPLLFDVKCPQAEGGYRLTLTARPEENFTTRLVPGQKPKSYATREIDIVVVDPKANLPVLGDHWIPILSIAPSNPSWWQRLPSWAQVSRLSGKPPESIGNVRLIPRLGDADGLVEIPPPAQQSDPTWQAFALPVLETGVPHLIEVAYPKNVQQHLGISIVEPDAAGRVNASVVDSGLYVDEVVSKHETELAVHRLVFWPRTHSPQLLIVNRHGQLPGVFGTLTLSRHDDATSSLAVESEKEFATRRLLAGYIAKPVFAQNFGAPETLDPSSGMSVQSWTTFLEGARRMTQFLRLSGYNSVFVSVAADGSALYPSDILMPSPRYDTGQLAASGRDPYRKDVLELLLQVCDREKITIIPTIDLDTPLPRLEKLRSDTNQLEAGITCIDDKGRELRELDFIEANPQFGYNLLHESVQQEILALFDELVEQGCSHSAFAGVGIQLDSSGTAMLPGLEWGFDDHTCARFTAATGINLPTQGEDRFRKRAAILLSEQRQAWQSWKTQEITGFYTRVAQRVRSRQENARVFLLTEGLFSSPALQQSIRQSVSSTGRVKQLLSERGIDLEQLAEIPGLQIANSVTQIPSEHLQEHVTNVVLNEVAMKGELLPNERRTTDQLVYPVTRTHLPSYDKLSPFGSEMTHLTTAHQPSPSGALRDYYLTGTISGRPLPSIIVGGNSLPMILDVQRTKLLQTISELPTEYTESRSLQKQPVNLRIQRTEDSTYLVCLNESPWKLQFQVDLDTSNTPDWQLLGGLDLSNENSESLSSGILSNRATPWMAEIEPYGLRAWKFKDPQLKVEHLRIMDDGIMQDYLEQKIAAIQDRTGNLDIERNYRQLQNPDFELSEGTSRIFGWQVRRGPVGTVTVESEISHSGVNSLQIASGDELGVAAQSHLFPIPVTGQLVVSAYVKAGEMGLKSRLIVAVETEDDGRTYRRYKTFTADDLPPNQWSRCELSLNDLPVGDANQIRVQFHATGKTDLLVDDVELCDLRFDDQRRSELVKRVYAAKTALGDQQVVDCLRLVNEYWSRYLVEYVPPVEHEPVVLAKQPPATETSPEENRQKVGGRFRRLMPKIWR
ncbi:glycoside hydrolase family 10 protein [Bythopirellula goksoeyrii]|nr:hypothetical protein [Bythopirellula goksoeyrii]